MTPALFITICFAAVGLVLLGLIIGLTMALAHGVKIFAPEFNRIPRLGIAFVPAFILSLAIVCGVFKFLNTYAVPHSTRVTKQEAEAFVTIGRDEKDVIEKFGRPFLKSQGAGPGTEVLTYLTDPRSSDPDYGGFEVFVKDGKVTYLGIILQSDAKHRPPAH